MNEKNILSALGSIDDKYIKEMETHKMTKTKKWGISGLVAVASVSLLLGVYTQVGKEEPVKQPEVLFDVQPEVSYDVQPEVLFDLTDRIIVSETAIGGKQMVNIEGVITNVLDNGLTFELDNGMIIIVEDTTKIGTDVTSELAKEMQLVEPTFRAGNSISGYAEDVESEEIIATQIYTNWNWENPIP